MGKLAAGHSRWPSFGSVNATVYQSFFKFLVRTSSVSSQQLFGHFVHHIFFLRLERMELGAAAAIGEFCTMPFCILSCAGNFFDLVWFFEFTQFGGGFH